MGPKSRAACGCAVAEIGWNRGTLRPLRAEGLSFEGVLRRRERWPRSRSVFQTGSAAAIPRARRWRGSPPTPAAPTRWWRGGAGAWAAVWAGGPGADRGADARPGAPGPDHRARGDPAGRGDPPLSRDGGALQAGTPGGYPRRPRLLLPAGRLPGHVPRAAPAEHGADQSDQTALHVRGLLAGGRAPAHAAGPLRRPPPRGASVRMTLERYIVDLETQLGYRHVYTPDLADVELYKISGHWEHFRENMYPP